MRWMKRQPVLLCAIRKQKYECAEIIQYKLHKEGIAVSLSSVKRTIRAARIMAEKEKIPPERKETDANRPGRTGSDRYRALCQSA